MTCKTIIDYLNQKTGRNFRAVPVHCKLINARLKEGYTAEDIKKVIDTKLQDPFFKENPKYLNPQTLFRPSNFDRYLNEDPERDYKQNQDPDSVYYKRAGLK